jgi:hypothetical protein
MPSIVGPRSFGRGPVSPRLDKATLSKLSPPLDARPLKAAVSNYRMKLTRLGHRLSRCPDSLPCPGWLAETRLGLQLMRGR